MLSDEDRSSKLNGTDPPVSASAALEEITFAVCGYSVTQTYDYSEDGIAHNKWTVDENDWAGQLIEDTCGGLVNPIQCALAGFDEAFNNTITAQFVNPETGRVDEKWMSTVRGLYRQYIETTVGPRLAVLSGKFKKELMDKYSGDEVPSFPKDGAEGNAASKEAFREKYYAAVKAFISKDYADFLSVYPDNLPKLNHQASQMLGGLAIPKTNTLPAVMTKDTFRRNHQGGYSVETIYPQFTARHDKDHPKYDGSRVVVTTYYNNGDKLLGTEARIEQPAVLKDCDITCNDAGPDLEDIGRMKQVFNGDKYQAKEGRKRRKEVEDRRLLLLEELRKIKKNNQTLVQRRKSALQLLTLLDSYGQNQWSRLLSLIDERKYKSYDYSVLDTPQRKALNTLFKESFGYDFPTSKQEFDKRRIKSLGEMKRRIEADHEKVKEQNPVECMMRLMSYGNTTWNQESKNHQTALIKGELIVHLMLQAERAREQDVNFSGHLHKLDCQVNGWGVDLFVAKLDDPYILLMRINAHLAAIKHFGEGPNIEEYKKYKRLCVAIQNESNPDQWLRDSDQLNKLVSIEDVLSSQKKQLAQNYLDDSSHSNKGGGVTSDVNPRKEKIKKALAELCKNNIDLKNENQWYVAALQGALFGCTTIGCKSDQDRGPKVEETINFLKAYLHSALPENVLSQVDGFFNGSELSATKYFNTVNILSQINCEGVTTTRTLRGDSTAAGSKLTEGENAKLFYGSNEALHRRGWSGHEGKPRENPVSHKDLQELAMAGLYPGGLGQDDRHEQNYIPIDDLMGLIVQEGCSAKELDALGGTKLNSVVEKLNNYTSDKLQAFFKSKRLQPELALKLLSKLDDDKLIEFFNNEGLQPRLALDLFSQLDDNKKQSPKILLAAFQKNVRCLQYAFTLNGEQGEGEIVQAIIAKYNENKPRNGSQGFRLFASLFSSASSEPAQEVISNIVGRLEEEEYRGGDSEKNIIVAILKSIIQEANSSPRPGS